MPRPNEPIKLIPPNANQITEIRATMKNGVQMMSYLAMTRDAVFQAIAAENKSGFCRLQTGDDNDSVANTEFILPINEICLIAISDVRQPSNIVKPNSGLVKLN